MKTINYTFADSTINTVAVSNELGEIIANMDKESHRMERRETRRHCSVELAQKQLDVIAVKQSTDLLTDLITRDDLADLNNAIAKLSQEQRQLVKKVFFDGQALKDIALEYGLSYQAVQSRLNVVLKSLRKSLNNFS